LLANYNGLSPNIVTPLEGIINKVSNGTIVRFNQGVDLVNNSGLKEWSPSLAGSSDVTIAVMGISAMIEGEQGDAISSDFNGDRNTISLPKHQINYIKSLRKISGDKPIILIIKAGSAIDLSEVSNYVDAIIYAWYLGEQGGNAIADIIFGDVNPSGKLPITIPKALSDLPEYNDYNMDNRTYRFYRNKPMYPFGYGLSYSKFIYSNLKIDKKKIKKGTPIKLNFDIQNISNISGEEVIQVYVKYKNAFYRTPNSSLIFFQKINLVAGEKKNIEVIINEDMMASIDEKGNKQIESGEFKLFVGGSSPGQRSNELGSSVKEIIFNVE